MTGQQPPDVPVFYAGVDAVSQLNLMSACWTFLESKIAFRARRAATGTVTKNAHTLVPWDTIDEDPDGGWTAGAPTQYVAQAPGWYAVHAVVSCAGTGATGTVLIPALSINSGSPTGQGTNGWEGAELFVPTGSDPKAASGYWEAYANVGDAIEIDTFLSSEPAANFTWQTTAGAQSRIEIIWMGV